MIKTLQPKLRLGSLKSDCQFHSYQGDGGSGLRPGRGEGIYEPGVGFDWAMIIPSKMITVRHPSDPVNDRISHFLLSSCSTSAAHAAAKTPACSSKKWYEPGVVAAQLGGGARADQTVADLYMLLEAHQSRSENYRWSPRSNFTFLPSRGGALILDFTSRRHCQVVPSRCTTLLSAPPSSQ